LRKPFARRQVFECAGDILGMDVASGFEAAEEEIARSGCRSR
jgi:hypothetical protein